MSGLIEDFFACVTSTQNHPYVLAIDKLEDCDLSLRVGRGRNTRDLAICSKTMPKLSAEWNKIIRHRPKRVDNERPIVRLPEDDPEVFRRMLLVIRGNYDRIEGGMNAERVFQVLQLTHKYHITRLVARWANDWVNKGWFSRAMGGTYPRHLMLSIACELGNKEVFVEELHEIAISCSKDEHGQLRDKDSRLLTETNISPLTLSGQCEFLLLISEES
ncbi:hypothetical protein QBC34DRAFT_455321 [Podospora aff. communis PSN243]|uniref:BTB domain-containing protein n=1 Tax=Podospora aff. communis PSN243 TaxID=3040156 RepID=A0AAV9GX80_9PEZI|nr:hypothetical protein QBC34DRAFT_455321 [Podospora aff. communis PSN243]